MQHQIILSKLKRQLAEGHNSLITQGNKFCNRSMHHAVFITKRYPIDRDISSYIEEKTF